MKTHNSEPGLSILYITTSSRAIQTIQRGRGVLLSHFRNDSCHFSVSKDMQKLENHVRATRSRDWGYLSNRHFIITQCSHSMSKKPGNKPTSTGHALPLRLPRTRHIDRQQPFRRRGPTLHKGGLFTMSRVHFLATLRYLFDDHRR